MSLKKNFVLGAFLLFGTIAVLGYLKKRGQEEVEVVSLMKEEIPIPRHDPVVAQPASGGVVSFGDKKGEGEELSQDLRALPEADHIDQLFTLDSSKLPFIETVSYTSRVPWLKGRPAWIADYASYFETSRHFIARSLNRKLDYFTQKVSPGDRFNVFKKDAEIEFHLVIDLSRSKLWFYCVDLGTHQKYLLKTYPVGLGRLNPKKTSGSLTPIGKYLLGEKVAIYKPGTMGFFQDEKTEMIKVFGTRWIPFEKEVDGCSEPARGFGLHGAPWIQDAKGVLVEDTSKIGKYESDGCVRLASQDIEELFSIVITKPTYVEVVKDFFDANIPGSEVDLSIHSPLKPKL